MRLSTLGDARVRARLAEAAAGRRRPAAASGPGRGCLDSRAQRRRAAGGRRAPPRAAPSSARFVLGQERRSAARYSRARDRDRDRDALLAAARGDPDARGSPGPARRRRRPARARAARRARSRRARAARRGAPRRAPRRPRDREPDDDDAAREGLRGVDAERHAPDAPDDLLRPASAAARSDAASSEQERERARYGARHRAASARRAASRSAASSSGRTVRRSITRTRSSATRTTTGGRPARSAAASAVGPAGAGVEGDRHGGHADRGRGAAADRGLALDERRRAGPGRPRRARRAKRLGPRRAARASGAWIMRSTGTRSSRAPALVLDERRVEGGERHLVDAQGAVERVPAHRLDEGPAPGDEAGLRAAEQLVAAEGHDVARRRAAPGAAVASAASAPGSASRRPLPWSSTSGIPRLARELGELLERRLLGEADDAEVARVDLQDQAGLGGERGPEVGEARAVRGPDLAQPRAALARARPGCGTSRRSRPARPRLTSTSRPSASVFTARSTAAAQLFTTTRRLDPEQLAQPRLGVGLAVAALAPLEVVLEVRVGRGDLGHARGGLGGERRAAEVRVDDDARWR